MTGCTGDTAPSHPRTHARTSALARRDAHLCQSDSESHSELRSRPGNQRCVRRFSPHYAPRRRRERGTWRAPTEHPSTQPRAAQDSRTFDLPTKWKKSDAKLSRFSPFKRLWPDQSAKTDKPDQKQSKKSVKYQQQIFRISHDANCSPWK